MPSYKKLTPEHTMASTSRPAPKIAAPIDYDGIRYQQDQEGTPGKAFGAAYLAAIDVASGKLLWILKIADAIHYPPGSPWEFGPIYLEKIETGPAIDTLALTTQHGRRYVVDLQTRQVKLVHDPADFMEPDKHDWSASPPPPAPPPPKP
ncbi:MAG: hypothetical protein RL748_3223 [Pseudomonadota bacterium]|jgi:hypothetical protein